MREEYERVVKIGMPGSIILLSDTGKIEGQHSGFAPESVRHGRAEDGSQYDPTVVEKGHPNFDMGVIADAIKAMPETDPDAPEEEPNRFDCPDCGHGVKADEDGCCSACGRDCVIVEDGKPVHVPEGVANSIVDGSADMDRRAEDLSKRLKEVEAALALSEIRAKTKAEEGAVKVAPEPKSRPVGGTHPFAPRGPFGPEIPKGPKMPPPRSERTRGKPCASGPVGWLSFFTSMKVYVAQMDASQDRISRRRRRFAFEILLRLASGAPMCESTVHASYSDAEDATRM